MGRILMAPTFIGIAAVTTPTLLAQMPDDIAEAAPPRAVGLLSGADCKLRTILGCARRIGGLLSPAAVHHRSLAAIAASVARAHPLANALPAWAAVIDA